MRARDRLWIEVRAAEIAQLVLDGRMHWEHGVEMAGWARRGDGREGLWPKHRRWHAGHLAAQVWYHRLFDTPD